MPTQAPSPGSGQAFGFNTPFQAQIDHLRQKLDLPTDKWDDIVGRAHDRAFVVAGAAKADLLADLHAQINLRAQDGAGLNAFRKDFKAIVAKHGWTGWTGEGTKEGEAWRTRVIYQTNMASSYAAGRHAQMSDPEVLKLHPYWRYIHSEGAMHPRPLHLSWHGLTLPAGHPFFQTHFAPNGWGCQCRITSVTRREGEASARAGLGEPPADWQAIDPKTGAPVGIDKGFDYAPGASAKRPLQELIDAKLIKLDAPLGAQMWEALKPVLAMERPAAYADWLQTVIEDPIKRGRTMVVGSISVQLLEGLKARFITPATAEIAISDSILIGKKEVRHKLAGDALTEQEWQQLPALLAAPEQVLFDTRSGHLLYIASSSDRRKAKLAVEFDFLQKKSKGQINLIVSAYKAVHKDIQGAIAGGIYEVMK